jgi:FixJ family two-component response regulator
MESAGQGCGINPIASTLALSECNNRGCFRPASQLDYRDMITLVDDDPGVLEANASLLRSLGYDVKTFESSRELLNWSGLGEACCVITDVMMPEIDGFELQRRLALQGFTFPVIFLTAITETAARDRLLRGGAYDVLSKPCPEQRLIDCLQAALEHCRRLH